MIDEPSVRAFLEASGQVLLGEAVKVAEEKGDTSHYEILPLGQPFQVRTEHLIRACNSFLRREVGPAHLRALAFCLSASDDFFVDARSRDGRRVARALDEWVAPEIHRPLNEENVRLWKEYLGFRLDVF